VALFLGCLAIACTGREAGGGSGGPAASPTPEDIARAAVLYRSCVADGSASGWADRFWESALGGRDTHLWESARCISRHGGGCEALEACLGLSMSSPAGCEPGCDGATVVGCDDLTYRLDCSRFGKECVDGGRGESRCATPIGGSCDPDSFEESCDGDRPRVCMGGTMVLEDSCSDRGLMCTIHDVYGAVCAGPDGPCDTEGCEGSVVTTCVNDGALRKDCASVESSLTCVEVGAAHCSLADECRSFDFTDTCSGTVLIMCNAGRVVEVDCATLGFEGCHDRLASCVPNVGTCVYETCYEEATRCMAEGGTDCEMRFEECASGC